MRLQTRRHAVIRALHAGCWAAVAGLAPAGAAGAQTVSEFSPDDAVRFDAVAAEPAIAATPPLRARAADALAAPRFVRSEHPLPVGVPGPALAAGRAEIAGLSHRWWHSVQRTDVGVGLGTLGYHVAPLAGTDAPPHISLRNPVPSVSVGMRYRVAPGSAIYADASTARGLYGKGSDAYFTQLGVEWQSAARPGWALSSGGIALRLDSGKSMHMRIKGGGLGLYLRSKF